MGAEVVRSILDMEVGTTRTHANGIGAVTVPCGARAMALWSPPPFRHRRQPVMRRPYRRQDMARDGPPGRASNAQRPLCSPAHARRRSVQRRKFPCAQGTKRSLRECAALNARRCATRWIPGPHARVRPCANVGKEMPRIACFIRGRRPARRRTASHLASRASFENAAPRTAGSETPRRACFIRGRSPARPRAGRHLTSGGFSR